MKFLALTDPETLQQRVQFLYGAIISRDRRVGGAKSAN